MDDWFLLINLSLTYTVFFPFFGGLSVYTAISKTMFKIIIACIVVAACLADTSPPVAAPYALDRTLTQPPYASSEDKIASNAPVSTTPPVSIPAAPVLSTVTEPPVVITTTAPPVATTVTEPPVATTVNEPPVATTATEPPVATTATEPPVATTATEPPVATTATEPPVASSIDVTSAPVVATQAPVSSGNTGKGKGGSKMMGKAGTMSKGSKKKKKEKKEKESKGKDGKSSKLEKASKASKQRARGLRRI